MSQLKFGSAGVTAKEIDLTGPTKAQPVGVPAGIIGTSVAGRAFVPTTVGSIDDFYLAFGKTDGEKLGPLAAVQWLTNATAATYLRVLGVGDGNKRNTDGSVTNAGFTVGAKLPDETGIITENSYAWSGGPVGRTYFLGCFMSSSAGSSFLSDAGAQASETAVPMMRGVLMAPSGVLPRLVSSFGTNTPPLAAAATDASAHGSSVGLVNLAGGKQEFIVLLNGHKGTLEYPNVITASFDMTSPSYFKNAFNTDPTKIQQAGHVLYTGWDIDPKLAVVTGSGLVVGASGSAVNGGFEPSALLLSGALSLGASSTSTQPNYEKFLDRFDHAETTWFVSQKFGGKPLNLFKLHSISDGAGISNKYKISIENIVPSSDLSYKFGSFDVVIRDINDTDSQQVVLEQWRACSLDPSSDRYIAKVIGDNHIYFDFDHETRAQKLVVNGNYPNNSNLVWVEVDSSVENGMVPPESIPMGFRGLGHLVTSGSDALGSVTNGTSLNPLWNSSTYSKLLVEPPVPLRKNIQLGSGSKSVASSQLYWGVQLEHPLDLVRLNEGAMKNKSFDAFTKYFPNYDTSGVPFFVSDNAGAADTAGLGVIDCDRFNNNLFTLENVQVVTGSDGLADASQWKTAAYVRGGSIVADPVAKTRATSVSDFVSKNRKFMKFTTVMQGGFDGVNIFDSDSAKLNNAAVDFDMADINRGQLSGPNVAAYRKALDIMSNTSDVELQLLAIPGIRTSAVTDYAINSVESRFDALFVMDIEQKDENDSVIERSGDAPVSVRFTTQAMIDRDLNTSFAAAYFPDVVVTDPNTQTSVIVPPSVAVLGALALNDAVGYPWFAPAGFTRGALNSVLEADVKLSKDNMDTLYDANINPIVSFPGTATNAAVPGNLVVWGQKTLLNGASALDRVNVRRLLIEIRRQVRQVSQTIIFEPNRETTLARFSAAVTPILQRIQSLAGVERFKVIIDASTTTKQDVENNTLRGKIYVQPTKSIEFVSLDFLVTNNIAQQK
jgi:phage tail sheath protein FI